MKIVLGQPTWETEEVTWQVGIWKYRKKKKLEKSKESLRELQDWIKKTNRIIGLLEGVGGKEFIQRNDS